MTRGTRTTAQRPSQPLSPSTARRYVGWRRAVLTAVLAVAIVLAAASAFLGRFTSDRNASLRNDEATTLVSARSGAAAALNAVRSGAGRPALDTRLPGRHLRLAGAITWLAALLVLGGVIEMLLDRTAIGTEAGGPSAWRLRGPPSRAR